jgi:hypothetical protein
VLPDATPQTVSTVFPRERTAVPTHSTGPFRTALPNQSTEHPPGQLRPTHSPFQAGLTSPPSHHRPPQPSTSPSPPRIQLDRLGKLICSAVEALNDGLSFQELCVWHRGPSCLADPSALPHPAAPLLQQLLETGAPVHQIDPPWSLSDLDAAVRRGAHRSTRDHQEFLREEFADMTEAGQWLVLPYSLVRHLKNLRLTHHCKLLLLSYQPGHRVASPGLYPIRIRFLLSPPGPSPSRHSTWPGVHFQDRCR